VAKIELKEPRAFIPNEMRFTTVRVTSYSDRSFAGYFETPARDGPTPFQSLTQLLLSLDDLSDELGFPQRSRAPRSLVRKRDGEADAQAQAPPGKPLASFRICIMFRQNASWQGSCEWIEENRSANFRSVLELIRLMDGVLSGKQEPTEL